MLRSAQAFSIALLLLFVGDDRHRDQVVRRERLRVRERFEHAAVHAADEHDDRVVHAARLVVGRDAQALGDRVVVPLDRLEQHDDRGDDDERDPRAVVNFVDRDDDQHDEASRSRRCR